MAKRRFKIGDKVTFHFAGSVLVGFIISINDVGCIVEDAQMNSRGGYYKYPIKVEDLKLV